MILSRRASPRAGSRTKGREDDVVVLVDDDEVIELPTGIGGREVAAATVAAMLAGLVALGMLEVT